MEIFIGKGSDISLKATDNTDLRIKGVVMVNFSYQNSMGSIL